MSGEENCCPRTFLKQVTGNLSSLYGLDELVTLNLDNCCRIAGEKEALKLRLQKLRVLSLHNVPGAL